MELKGTTDPVLCLVFNTWYRNILCAHSRRLKRLDMNL